MATANSALPAGKVTSGEFPGGGIARAGIVCLCLFCICLGLAWRSGLFDSEFGRYQDEGMHYITGLFVQDFLVSGQWSHPMQFAQQYYLHLPKVALGQWPPGFSVMQAAWGLIFGVSRESMLLGMLLLTTSLAFLVWRAGEKYFGPLWGLLGAVLLIAAPLTQQHSAMVMAEIPLAAVSFLSICACVRFLETERPRDAIAFAAWTVCANMIKGNGWDIVLAVPLIIVFAGKLRLLANKWLWISAAIIAVLCVPYTVLTMRILTQGWDTTTFPGFPYEWLSLEIHLGFVARLLGIPMAVVAAGGAISAFFGRDLFWKAIVIYGAAVIVFHVAIPSSIEPRKIYQIVPVMCLLALKGLDLLAGILPAGLARLSWPRPALACLGALVFLLTGFSLLPEYDPGFGPAVQQIADRPDTRGEAILISSNPEYADSEAAIISEWAARRRNDGTFLIRGTKLLSHPVVPVPGQSSFRLNFATHEEVLKALSSIPISWVILHTTEASTSYPHHALLKAALDGDPADWQLVSHTDRFLAGLRENHDIEVYRCRKNLTGIPIRYSVDLTRKIGTQVTTSP